MTISYKIQRIQIERRVVLNSDPYPYLTDDDPQRSSRTIGRISAGLVLDSKSVEISKSDPFNTLLVLCILFIYWCST